MNLTKIFTTVMVGAFLFNFSNVGCASAKEKNIKRKLSSYKESTIYYNGNIITVNDEQPIAEAVAVGDGKIISVGSQDEILKQRSKKTRLVNLNGKTMLPGFIDAHSHIALVGKYDEFTSAQGVTSVEKLVERGKVLFEKWYENSVNEGSYEEGDWYVGTGYDNTVYKGAINPTADDLDKISSEVPICIIHSSNHIAVVNHKALEILGYTKGSSLTEQFSDYIEKDSEGNPTGCLRENAFFRLYFQPAVLSDNTKTNTKKSVDAFKEAMNTYASYGITSAQDGAGSNIDQIVKELLEKEDKLMIDVDSYSSIDTMTTPSSKAVRDRGFRKLGVKLILDGSPQGKTAWFNEPYYIVPDGEDKDYRGHAAMSDEEVYNTLVKCLENGYQVLAHVNGTASIDQYINQYEKAKNDTGITTDIRPVLIHAQTITEEQLEKAKKLGMNISFFSDHVYYWGDYHMSSVLGPERGARISPLSSAVNRGINVTMHQDSPVVPPNMIFSIHNAVNRETSSGKPIGKEFAVDVMTAIKFVTINSAYQSFEEDIKGSIEPGKLADLVILDKNPLKVNKKDIKNIKVLKTIKEDKEIYSAKDDMSIDSSELENILWEFYHYLGLL